MGGSSGGDSGGAGSIDSGAGAGAPYDGGAPPSGPSGGAPYGGGGLPSSPNDDGSKADAFDNAMNDNKAQAPDQDGLPPSDTTPDYSGPTPDPRGPALSDPPGGDKQDEDDQSVAKPGPGDLPPSDTTPDYAGPAPDPRGPALDKPADDGGSEESYVDEVLETIRQTFNNYREKARGARPRGMPSPNDLIRSDPYYEAMRPPFDAMNHAPRGYENQYFGGESNAGGGGGGFKPGLLPHEQYGREDEILY